MIDLSRTSTVARADENHRINAMHTRTPGLLALHASLLMLLVPAVAAAQGTGDLKISSDPDGAWVEIDGKKIDACETGTPCTVEGIPSGPHSVKVSKGGYVDGYKNVNITTDVVDKIHFDLALEGGGTVDTLPTVKVDTVAEEGLLTVKTNPSGLVAYINGKQVAEPTPCTLQVVEGFRYVKIYYKGVAFEEHVDVKPNTVTKIFIDAKKKYSKHLKELEKKKKAELKAKKKKLDELMKTGYAEVIIESEPAKPITGTIGKKKLSLNGDGQALVEPGDAVDLELFLERFHPARTTLGLEKDHRYRLELKFAFDFDWYIAQLMASRPDIEKKPLAPAYLDETYLGKKNKKRCTAGAVLLPLGATMTIVGALVAAFAGDGNVGALMAGVFLLITPGGIMVPAGIGALAGGCKKVEKTSTHALEKNEEMKDEYEKQLKDWQVAETIDQAIDELEKKRKLSIEETEVEVIDLGKSETPLLPPELMELYMEVYGGK